MLFISLFFGAYFYLLNSPAYPTTVMPVIRVFQLTAINSIFHQTAKVDMVEWIYMFVSVSKAVGENHGI